MVVNHAGVGLILKGPSIMDLGVVQKIGVVNRADSRTDIFNRVLWECTPGGAAHSVADTVPHIHPNGAILQIFEDFSNALCSDLRVLLSISTVTLRLPSML